MHRVMRQLAVSTVFGGSAGLLFGVWSVLSHDYLRQGLHGMALGELSSSGMSYMLVALVAGLVAAGLGMILNLLVPAADRTTPGRPEPHDAAAASVLPRGRWRTILAHVLSFGMLALASLPVWVWSVRQHFGLYPRNKPALYTWLVLLLVLHLVGYVVWACWPRLRGAIARPTHQLARLAIVLAVATLVLSTLASLRLSPPDGEQPNLLVVILDTVRRDRLSCYGYEHSNTPHIDAFAAEGIRFESAFSTSSWTLPSHASMFTGLFTAAHRASQERLRLDDRFATLAEILRDRGYRTWAVSGNPVVGWSTGLSQGFESFREPFRRLDRWRLADGAVHPNNLALRRFLRTARRDRPFFAFVNYIEAHGPYLPPEPYRSRVLPPGVDPAAAERAGRGSWARHYLRGPNPEANRLKSRLYDGEIAYLDALFGDLLQVVREDGRYHDTLIVLASDHGEHFGENGAMEHVLALYNATVRVPLILKLPEGDRAGETSRQRVQLVDLFPTLLRVGGVERIRMDQHGIDLLGDSRPSREAIFSEYYWPAQVLSLLSPRVREENAARLAPYLHRLRAYQKDGQRLIWSSDGRHELYELTVDPGETTDLLAGASDLAPGGIAATLSGELDALVTRYAGGRPFPPEPGLGDAHGGLDTGIDPDAEEALRSLGYVD